MRLPPAIAILLALVLNLASLGNRFREVAVGTAIGQTLEFVGGMRLSWGAIQESIGVVALRLAMDSGFEAAIFTFFILPPPCTVPLFIKQEQ